MRNLIVSILVAFLPAVADCAEINEQIQSGTATFVGGSQQHLTFSVSAVNLALTGEGFNTEPPCDETGPGGLCKPGDGIPGLAFSSYESGLSGTITLNGQTHSWGADASTAAYAGIEFLFNISVPAANSLLPSLVLTGPFTSDGGLYDPAISPDDLIFRGGGMVSIYLDLVSFPPEYSEDDGYRLREMQFTFGEAPEPATAWEIVLAAALLIVWRLTRPPHPKN